MGKTSIFANEINLVLHYYYNAIEVCARDADVYQQANAIHSTCQRSRFNKGAFSDNLVKTLHILTAIRL